MLTPIAPPNHWPTRTTSSTSVTLGAGDATIVCTNTSNATVTLPSAAGVPFQIYTIKKGADNTATVTITPDGSETIDGADDYVLYIVGDYVTIHSDGSNYHVVGGYLAPHACRVYRSSSQLLSASTYNRINFNAAIFDRGGIADITTDGRIEIRRTGVYEITGYFGVDNNSNNFTLAQIWVDGAVVAVSTAKSTNNAAYTRVLGNLTQTISAGSYIDWYCNPGGSNYTPPTDSAGSPWLAVTEVR